MRENRYRGKKREKEKEERVREGRERTRKKRRERVRRREREREGEREGGWERERRREKFPQNSMNDVPCCRQERPFGVSRLAHTSKPANLWEDISFFLMSIFPPRFHRGLTHENVCLYHPCGRQRAAPHQIGFVNQPSIWVLAYRGQHPH